MVSSNSKMTEAESEFPYVFKCKKCEEQHIAISLQPWMIEWLYDRLKHYAKEEEDKQHQMEAGIARHILEVKIKPALDELNDKDLTGGIYVETR
jgi:hypothetical protein